MTKNTKHLLVAGGFAASAAVVIGTILLWPKTASAKSNPPLPLDLDANLTDQQKADVGNLLNNVNDPAKLAEASWNYDKAFNAAIASDLLAKKALSIIAPQLDEGVNNQTAMLYALYISTDPIELQGIALKLQSENFPKAAKLVGDRARLLSGL